MMKKIMALLVGLFVFANVAFAMSGYVEVQTINGVHIGMSADEVVAKWGEPIKTDMVVYVMGNPTYRFIFNPGGLEAGFFTWSFSGKVNDPYLSTVTAINNPQIVLQPSGVGIGVTTEEVIRRLGNPDKKIYIGYDFEKDTGPIYCYRYVTPQYTNFSGRTGSETVEIYVDEKTNRVTKIQLGGTFVHRK